MTAELIPLKPDQHPVTRLPKFTTELPFFYLTKQKEALQKPIDFQTTDDGGKPVRWKVTPNTTIGAPGIEAHEVWVRLVKPAIDAQRRGDGIIPLIIPLGGARECLRLLGWQQGGFQARRILERLDQIGAARCEADFWMPTLQRDAGGSPLFIHIKAKFSKFDIYAIGSAHLTAESIRNGEFNFDFDLEDTIYLKLSDVEAQLQQTQPYRLIDNEYLFSVNPAARRWCELLAPKFYGVVKNARKGDPPGFCEIRYSWYVERHHTLQRETERFRVAKQMNKLIRDHLQFGYVLKVEYRPLHGAEEKDFIIRYYPGQYAQVTTARILSRLAQQRTKRPEAMQLPLPIEPPPTDEAQKLPDTTSASAEEEELVRRLCEVGITPEKAGELVIKRRESVERELEAWPERNLEGVKEPAAWLIKAIEKGNYSQPRTVAEKRAREKKRRADESQRALETARERHQQRFGETYSAYVRQRVEEIKKSHHEAYRTFEETSAEDHKKTEHILRGRPFLAQKVFEGEAVNYFCNHPECPILDFWQWDKEINPTPFKESAKP